MRLSKVAKDAYAGVLGFASAIMETSYGLSFTIQGQNLREDYFSIDFFNLHKHFIDKLLRSDADSMNVSNAKKSEIDRFHREKIYRFYHRFLNDIQAR